ncbi:ATP-binding protein [Streptomyces sp. NPDC001089]
MGTKQQEQDALVARSAFPSSPEAVRPAREWAATVYRGAGGSVGNAETCALLVSELATNAIIHAEGVRFEVTVWSSRAVDVMDGSTKPPIEAVLSDEDEHGRGMFLVAALAERYEVLPTLDGKIIRFWLDER